MTTPLNSIQTTYENLKEGQAAWRALSLEKRLACIDRFSVLLLKNKEALAQTLTRDMGKAIREARNEIEGARQRIDYFLKHAGTWLAPQTVNQNGPVEEILTFEPLGVIGNISAWNYPYLVGVNVIVPALIAGNSVLYKPSEHAEETGKQIAALLHQAGVPQNVFQPLLGDGKTGRLLLDLPLDGYFFTGSYKTGAQIAKQVGHRLVPVGLELGGKDPLYVTDEIKDVRQVARSAVEGCFYNNGQSCCAVERIYVHQKNYAPFLEAFIEETQKLRQGDPFNEDTDLGPLARKEQVDVLNAQIENALQHGAEIALGGVQEKLALPYFTPTVLTQVTHGMTVMREETFGPLIGIQEVRDDREALYLMQDTDYGLTACVYSANIPRAQGLLKQLNVGNGLINCCDRVTPYLPWSGRQHSGFGATLSYLGILAFCQPKGYQIKSV